MAEPDTLQPKMEMLTTKRNNSPLNRFWAEGAEELGLSFLDGGFDPLSTTVTVKECPFVAGKPVDAPYGFLGEFPPYWATRRVLGFGIVQHTSIIGSTIIK